MPTKPTETKKRAVVPPSMPPAGAGVAAKPEAPRAEIDPQNLSLEEAQKRCAVTYQLEKTILGKRKLNDLAKQSAKNAKSALAAAEEALAQEIEEQRFGPGPLFDLPVEDPEKT